MGMSSQPSSPESREYSSVGEGKDDLCLIAATVHLGGTQGSTGLQTRRVPASIALRNSARDTLSSSSWPTVRAQIPGASRKCCLVRCTTWSDDPQCCWCGKASEWRPPNGGCSEDCAFSTQSEAVPWMPGEAAAVRSIGLRPRRHQDLAGLFPHHCPEATPPCRHRGLRSFPATPRTGGSSIPYKGRGDETMLDDLNQTWELMTNKGGY